MPQTQGNAITYEILGSVEPGHYLLESFNKPNDVAALAGRVWVADPGTKNYKPATAGATGSFAVIASHANHDVDSQLTQGYIYGRVYCLAGAALVPGEAVGPGADSKVVPGSGLGRFLRLPGDDGMQSRKKDAAADDVVLILMGVS